MKRANQTIPRAAFPGGTTALLLALLLNAGCSPSGSASDPQATAQPPAETNLAELVPYGAEPWPGIVTGGQPSKEDFEALQAAGLRSVINLRMPDERGTQDEPAWMDELGLDYRSIPVAGADGLSEDVARDLEAALAEAQRPVLVHCGSSNRVGAAFALKAYHLEGIELEEAVAIGQAAGMTRLEGRVRELLTE